MAAKAAYGPNPHAGINPNDIPAGWGGYEWPQGVPAALLHTESFDIGGTSGTLTMRKELFPLVPLCMRIAHDIYGYTIYGSPNPGGDPTWGPWTYENRCISGTSTPSNHSKARAWDWNAPRNPFSYTFQSDIPPELVSCMESLGWYWGGRYVGQKFDPMHFEFVLPLSQVAAMTDRAQSMLGTSDPRPSGAEGTITPTPEDDMQDADWTRLQKMIDDSRAQILAAIPEAAPSKVVKVTDYTKTPPVTSNLALTTIAEKVYAFASAAAGRAVPTAAQIAAAIKTVPAGASPEAVAEAVVKAFGDALS